MPVFEFSAYVVVKANDAKEARLLAEKATEEVQLANEGCARAVLDDGASTPLDDEDF